ncbi:hypothetical protein V5O48_017256 [Marasmius crinis-equi]|uniref:Uncharacterized protein n=1 Tax=Marasmius crinis-equi TaxID=585013 RepID=A0ABR3EPI0_9AGAR
MTDQMSEQIDELADIGKTPLLETLVFGARCAERIFGSLRYAPYLRSVEYQLDDSGTSDLDNSMDTVSWSTLPHLDLDYGDKDTPITVLNALHLGSGSQSFVYHCGYMSYDFSGVAYDPVVSNVFMLSLHVGSKEGIYALFHDIFRGVTLPSLTTLGIQFIDFMDCSGCTLTTLSLEGVPLTEADVIRFLKLTPAIHTFILCELWASAPEI